MFGKLTFLKLKLNAYIHIAGLIKTNIWNLVFVDFSNQRPQFKSDLRIVPF